VAFAHDVKRDRLVDQYAAGKISPKLPDKQSGENHAAS